MVRAAAVAFPNVALGTAVIQGGVLSVQFAGGDVDGDLEIVNPPVVLLGNHRKKRRQKVRDGSTVVVGYEQRDRQRPFVLASSPTVRGLEEITIANPSLTGDLQWPVVARDVAGSWDTGVRDVVYGAPGATDPPYLERPNTFSDYMCSPRVALQCPIWIWGNGALYAFQILHVELGRTAEEERKADPSYLDSVDGNVLELGVDLADAPAWLNPDEMAPLVMTMHAPVGTQPSDLVDVVSLWYGVDE